MNDSKDNPRYKCSVAEASILQSERVSYVTLETSLVESNTAIFEPVPGVIGAQFLCPGLVRLENDKDKRKSRFVIRYINFSREHIQIDPGKILGYVQACERETLPMENDKYVFNAITERNEEEKMKASCEIINSMYPEGTQENQILRKLVAKYPSVFASGDDTPTVSPFFYHTIKLQSMPKPQKPYPIPACFYERVA